MKKSLYGGVPNLKSRRARKALPGFLASVRGMLVAMGMVLATASHAAPS